MSLYKSYVAAGGEVVKVKVLTGEWDVFYHEAEHFNWITAARIKLHKCIMCLK